MNNDDNVKTLSYVFIIVFMIIFIFIIIFLVKYVFSANSHEYDMPTTSTKRVDKSFKALNNADKLKYNKELYDNIFLIALNNAIGQDLKYESVNLLQKEESKFKYLYTYLKIKDAKEHINFDDINTISKNIFDTELDQDNFKKYLKDEEYNFEVNYANPMYCFKGTNLKTTDSALTFKVDLIDYNSEVCNTDYLDYDVSKVALKAEIGIVKSNNKYYLSSFVITN